MFMYISTPDPTSSIYFIVFCLLGILTCTFRTSCYSTRLSWAHIPVINWIVCLGQMVVTLLEVREKEKGVVAKHLLIQSLKTRSGLEPVTRCEPSTYQPIAPSGRLLYCICKPTCMPLLNGQCLGNS